jgi:hypothetical protein
MRVNTMALSRPLNSPLQSLSDHARWLYPLAVIVLAVVFGQFFGLGLGLLVFAGGALGGSIWLIWSSLQGLGSDAPITLEEALSLGAPSAEEEQKRAVLRALKDLEYERAVGKISEEDYASLAEHYRGEAKRLLRAVDRSSSPERERAERILAERLAAAGKPPAARKRSKAQAESDEVESDEAESDEAESDEAESDEAESGESEQEAEAAEAAEAEVETASAGKRTSSDVAH